MTLLPLAFLSPSFGELVLIAIIALLLYGSDLPQVAKTWGRAYQEFRKNLNGIQRDLNDAIYAEDQAPRRLQYYPEYRDEVDEPAEESPDHHSPVAEAAAAAEAAKLAEAQPAAPSERDHGAA
jgi:sec-independent protein translocase protein TatA